MPAEIIDGNQIAKSIRSQIRRRVKKLDFTPGLAVVQVGDDPASTIYVSNKEKDCRRVNFHSEVYKMPANTAQAEIINQVQFLNEREAVHGIIVQMPLIDKSLVMIVYKAYNFPILYTILQKTSCYSVVVNTWLFLSDVDYANLPSECDMLTCVFTMGLMC